MAGFLRKSWIYITFALYCILLVIAILRHEPWFDEAQAWLLARDSSIKDLMTKYMRYEGSPGLWHLLLTIPTKLHLPYAFLNIFSGSIAALSVFLFLRYSPFPKIIKLLYPFSFFALYQYAVVARSYVLLPLLLFLIAMAYENKMNRPVRYTVLLILLANVSLHGFIISLGLLSVYYIEILISYIKIKSPIKPRNLIPLISFSIITAFIIYQLKPPADIVTFASLRWDLSAFYTRTICMLGDALLTNITIAANNKTFFYSLSQVAFDITLVLTLFWLILRRKLLIFVVPLIGLGVLFTTVYANVWHQGTLLYLWLFVLWISFNDKDKLPEPVPKVRQLVTLAMALVLSVQVYWAFNSFIYDYKYNYSASREVADYIKNNGLDEKLIYMTSFHTISILPYFDKNIFCNYLGGNKPSFWLWSRNNNVYSEPYLNLSQYNPDYIVLGVKKYSSQRVLLDYTLLPALPGYKLEKCFDGGLYWKDKLFETDSFAIYARDPDN